MGIKFICDTCGRKLNVKAFLAGKRGICPHCGAKITIPTSLAEGASTATAGANKNQQEAGVTAQVPSSTTQQASPLAAPSLMATEGQGAEPIGQPVLTAVPLSTMPGTTAQASSAPLAAVPMAAVAGQQALPTGTAAPELPKTNATAPTGTTPPEPPPVDASSDPVAEAPGAMWYVRPPSGGRYGPANGELLKRWIVEGRVNADSLVWREGWAEWQTAGALFREFAAPEETAPASPDEVAPELVSATSSTANATGDRYRGNRSHSNTVGIAIVILLSLLAIGLFGALFYVINR